MYRLLNNRLRSTSNRGQEADLAFTWALAVVALVPRLFVALAWAHEPVWDGHYYHFGAERIAAGLGYSEDVVIDGQTVWKPWTHYPVGYSAFLGVIYRIFGSSIEVAPLANAVVGALTVVVVHRLARYYLSESRARWAGVLCALHPGLIVYSAVVMTEPLAALLLLAAAWSLLLRKDSWVAVVVAGVLLGLAALVRPASLLAIPLVVFLLVPWHEVTGAKNLVDRARPWWGAPWWGALVRTAVIGAVALVTILPWTARNCRVMDGCTLISTNGGWNLAIGALTTTGRFRTLKAADGCPIVTGQVQQDRCWAQVGLEEIRRAPLDWLAKAPLKLSQTYDHESFAIEYLHEAAPDQWPEERRQAGRGLLSLFHWLLMTAAALSPVAWVNRHTPSPARWVQRGLLLGIVSYALWCLNQDSPPFFVLIALTPVVAVLPLPGLPDAGFSAETARNGPGYYLLGLLMVTTLTHAVFFGDDRYHLVITPALCILAAAALRRETILTAPSPSPRERVSFRPLWGRADLRGPTRERWPWAEEDEKNSALPCSVHTS